MSDRHVTVRALQNIEDAARQLAARMAETDDPAALADLAGQLDRLDMGRQLVEQLHCGTSTNESV